jgi:hypothetical protein
MRTGIIRIHSFIGDGSQVDGGWKVNKGAGEIIVRAGTGGIHAVHRLDSVEQYFNFCSTDGFEEYVQISDLIVGVDTRHAAKLDVS